MADGPKKVESDTNAIIEAWEELAPNAKFADMTLDDYKLAIKPSLDARVKISKLETDVKAAMDDRDLKDIPTQEINDAVIKSIVADKNYGDDSALYERCGYVRKSDRGSGLTRKTPAAKAANAAARQKQP